MKNTRLEAIFTDVLDAILGVIERHGVTSEEYRTATQWLTEAGNQGYEIPLLLDVFLSTTVDNINNEADGATESNVEGPFYVPGAPLLSPPCVLPQRTGEPGEILFFTGSVRSVDGAPLAGAVLDVWQANGIGEYSHFHPDVPDFNLRGQLTTDENGRFEFRTVRPAPYEIPKDGATGRLLAGLGRPAFRPAHIHFKVTHEHARTLTTQVYFEGDPWIENDVVGAVKAPLVTALANRNGGGTNGRHLTCTYDFVLHPKVQQEKVSVGSGARGRRRTR